MYASEVDGQKLTFYVSGKLWGRSLVMGDIETGSDWSHILGRSMAGKMKGKSLTIIPATITTWKAWHAQHPETTATMLDPTAIRFTREFLEELKEYCMGLVHHGQSRYWRFDELKSQVVVNDQLAELEVVAYFDADSSTTVIWDRKTEHGVLTFESENTAIVDRETQSAWDLKIGRAIDGRLKGTRLKATSAIVSFAGAWQRFHPETTDGCLHRLVVSRRRPERRSMISCTDDETVIETPSPPSCRSTK